MVHDPQRQRLDMMTARRLAVEHLIASHMRHWGVDAHDVAVTWDRDGSSVPIVSTGGRSGSMRNVPFERNGTIGREGMEAVAAICFQAIRRILRRRSIVAAGHGPDDCPSWATSADPAILSCLRHHDVDLTNAPLDAAALIGRMRAAGLMVDQAGITDGTIRIGTLSDRSQTWSISDYDRLRVHVHQPVPDTILVALQGMRVRLEEIVLLPFPLPDRMVRRIGRADDGGIMIDLDRRLSTWSRVPDGIDRTWLRIPLARIEDIPF